MGRKPLSIAAAMTSLLNDLQKANSFAHERVGMRRGEGAACDGGGGVT